MGKPNNKSYITKVRSQIDEEKSDVNTKNNSGLGQENCSDKTRYHDNAKILGRVYLKILKSDFHE